MRAAEIISSFQTLDSIQKDYIMSQLISLCERNITELKDAVFEIDQNWLQPPACPHCGHNKTYRRGHYKNIPRYSCKKCQKYWMATYGTTVQGLKKKHLWVDYIQAFLQRQSLRSAAKQVGISLGTSFNWRHLILSTLNNLIPKELKGTVECMSLELPYVEKGRNNTPKINIPGRQPHPIRKPDRIHFIIAKSRFEGSLASEILAVNRPDHIHYVNQLEKITHPKNWVITPIELRKALKKTDRSVVFFGLGGKKRPIIHLRNVEKKVKKIIEFLKPFKGVSTKYLYGYLSWQNYLDLEYKPSNLIYHLLRQCLLIKNAVGRFKESKIYGINIVTYAENSNLPSNPRHPKHLFFSS